MTTARHLATLGATAFFLGLWLALAPGVFADEPPGNGASSPVVSVTPGPVGNVPTASGGHLPILPDPTQWATDVFNQVIMTVLRSLVDAIRSVVGSVLGGPLNFITQTPAQGTYASPTVMALWNAVRLIADAGLAIVALWGGVTLIIHAQTGSPYHEAMELIPRLILGALLANTSLSWGQIAIDLNNALCDAVGQASLPGFDQADATSQVLAQVVTVLIYLVMSLLLLIQMLMRLALVDVLLVVAPLGLLCWVLPQTQGWARLWSSTFTTAVFTQFLQVLALKLGSALVTDLTTTGAASLLTFFLGIAVLALTLRIPTLMRHQTGDGLGFLRYLAYRKGAQALGGGGGGAKGGG
ncbi:MAG TPA: conjugal transfer protein TrbL family protein [Chloroflexota bacterium]|nr:conjugal transfer protein TrbL family protein [Chloroflexota bacterium]